MNACWILTTWLWRTIMGGPNSGRKKAVSKPAAVPPKAQGKDKKRTPQSAFDPAAGKAKMYVNAYP